VSRPYIPEAIEALEDCLYVAVFLARFFATRSGEAFDPEQVRQMAGIPFGRASEAASAMEKMTQAGLCIRKDGTIAPEPEWDGDWDVLAYALQGALAHHELVRQRNRRTRPRIVVTTPNRAGPFACRIKDQTGLYVRSSQTSEVFRELAGEAKERLVIMTPFLDYEGADTVAALFRRADPSVAKHLVLRNPEGSGDTGCARGYPRIRGELASLGVGVHDFTLTRDNGTLETFHAKIVCKDRDQAYVGSANLTRENSIELGLLVFGETAENVADTVDIFLTLTKVV
jgi:hypothetical protein